MPLVQYLNLGWASLVAQLVKNPPAMWETWVRSLGWEDPLEKGKAAHSSVLAWRIPWTWGRKEWYTTERFYFHFGEQIRLNFMEFSPSWYLI